MKHGRLVHEIDSHVSKESEPISLARVIIDNG
jgi:hypothetical protein